ncbi:hypothetical protein MOSE0_F06942 [Monosporozyma servazzii]
MYIQKCNFTFTIAWFMYIISSSSHWEFCINFKLFEILARADLKKKNIRWTFPIRKWHDRQT